MNRKNFLRNVSFGALPVMLPQSVFSTHSETHFQPTTLVRKDVSFLKPDDPIIVSYKKAVAAMKALPKSDPRNWERQASIHDNFCPHRNWFFLPWHRAYLYYFEQICREMSGDANFALPYWNWSKSLVIPATFWGTENPLFDSTRAVGPNTSADPNQVGAKTIDDILRLRSFENFASGRATCFSSGGGTTGQLEGGPHNYIHGTFVLGNMRTFMSPLDPIFWLHHANCDRLWTNWNNRGNANTTDTNWNNCEFKNQFYNKQGMQVPSISISRLLKTGDLGYRYDDLLLSAGPRLNTAFSTLGTLAMRGNFEKNVLIPGSYIEAKLTIPDEALSSIEKLDVSQTISKNDKIVQLYIENVLPPKTPRNYIRVFLNCDDIKEALPVEDARSVGFIHFFGMNHASHDNHMQSGNDTFNYVFDITEKIKSLFASGTYSNRNAISIQLLSIPSKGSESSEISVGSVRIEVQQRVN